jgi:hypothetical protein
MAGSEELSYAHDAPEIASGPCVSVRRAIGSPAWNIGSGRHPRHTSRGLSAPRDPPSALCVEYERDAEALRVAQWALARPRVARTGLSVSRRRRVGRAAIVLLFC